MSIAGSSHKLGASMEARDVKLHGANFSSNSSC